MAMLNNQRVYLLQSPTQAMSQDVAFEIDSWPLNQLFPQISTGSEVVLHKRCCRSGIQSVSCISSWIQSSHSVNSLVLVHICIIDICYLYL